MRHYFLTLLLLGLNYLFAQSLQPTLIISKEDGLLQHTAWNIRQDALGRMWVGTQIGFQYYNGTDLQTLDYQREVTIGLLPTDSFMYCITVKGISKTNIYDFTYTERQFPIPDYYGMEYNDEGIFLRSSSGDDSLFYDYNLNLHKAKVFRNGSFVKGASKVPFAEGELVSHTEGAYYVSGLDSTLLLSGFSPRIVSYGATRAFVGAAGGLFEVKLVEEKISVLRHLADERVEELFLDKNRNLWVGTSGSGLYLVHRNTLMAEFFNFPNESEKQPTCWSMMEDGPYVLVGTSWGVESISSLGKKHPLVKLTKGIGCNTFIRDSNSIFVGTASQGIYRYDAGRLTQVYYNPKNVTDNTVVQFIKTKPGIVAFTKKSMVLLNTTGAIIWVKPYIDFGLSPYAMSARKNESGFVVSSTRDIWFFDENLNFTSSLVTDSIQVISSTLDFEGKMWCTSLNDGLLVYDGQKMSKRPFPSNHLYGIIQENESDLWINGVNKIYKVSGSQIRAYDENNGFPMEEYNQGGQMLATDGQLYYAGVGGVMRFYAHNLAYMPQLPNYNISSPSRKVLNSLVQLNYDESQLTLDIEPIVVTDRNYFEFAYKTDGRWELIGKNARVDLAPAYGDSEFQVRVRNLITGHEQIETWKVYRAFPFWMKTWFKVLLVVLVVLMALGLYSLIKFIQTKKLLKATEEENKISQDRLRISRELHDNIGARITHIISSLDVETYRAGEVNTGLEEISGFARQTMSQLRETIWAVSDKTLFFSEWQNRMEQYIDQIEKITESGIKLKAANYKDFEISSTQTINFYRIVQEALNNAVKYSSASCIQVVIAQDAGRMKIEVRDNGKGFDCEARQYGSGLMGMKNRAAEAGAEFNINSDKEGTTVSISFYCN